MAPQGDQKGGADGIELTTLFLSAIASAAAAYITSRIWAPGTLFSAAMSPVIVALVKEGLRRPTEKVADYVPAVATPSRWTRPGAGEPGLVPDPGAVPPAPAARVDPDAPHVVLPPVVATDHGPVNVYSTRSRRLRWRLAVITGLLGFGICVVLFTVPELISGNSIGRGSGDATTIFGGQGRKPTNKKSTTTTTSTTKTSTTETTPAAPDENEAEGERTTTQATPSSATPAPASSATPAPGTASSTTPAPSSTTPGAESAPTP